MWSAFIGFVILNSLIPITTLNQSMQAVNPNDKSFTAGFPHHCVAADSISRVQNDSNQRIDVPTLNWANPLPYTKPVILSVILTLKP